MLYICENVIKKFTNGNKVTFSPKYHKLSHIFLSLTHSLTHVHAHSPQFSLTHVHAHSHSLPKFSIVRSRSLTLAHICTSATPFFFTAFSTFALILASHS